MGVDGQQIEAVSHKKLSKVAQPTEATLALCFHISPEDPSTPVHHDLQALLSTFTKFFKKPSSLPPERNIAHCINLKEGTSAINIRP